MNRTFLSDYDVVLLDMGNTFMFNCDRFTEDMGATYCRLGGNRLSSRSVQELLTTVFNTLLEIGRNPACYESFPTVKQHLATMKETRQLPRPERDLLARVFALHEIGTISPAYAEYLRLLAQTKRLGVISNIWSESTIYLEAFESAGIRQILDTIVFSSDHGSIKPAQHLFNIAASGFSCKRSRMVYVGDNFNRDVVGAKQAGMASVWINPAAMPPPLGEFNPDLVISDLLTLHQS